MNTYAFGILASAIALFGRTASNPSHATVARKTFPRVAEDSIYRLAVDSLAYKEYSYVYLLDDGVAHYEADGKGTTTYRQVVQILKPGAVAQWAERSMSYQPDREKITMNWMRVVRLNGEVISEKPSQTQVSDLPAEISNPVYTQTKIVRYSLSNVLPGTIVDISWTKETINPPLAGNLLIGWNITLPTPGMRSRFILDVPTSFKPNIREHHLDFKRAETTSSGRTQYMWAHQNVTPVKSEIFAPDSSVPVMSIRIGAPMSWNTIGRWYYGLSKDRYTLSPRVIKSVDSVARQAKSSADTLKALHRWIAKDLRYVSVSLGIGGYQPRFPDSTVGTGYGDCKDKATLFIAAAAHLGIKAHPVLLSSAGTSDSMFPALEQFNHVIAAVERANSTEYTYLDLTTFDYPTGQIPTPYQGGFGLVVFADGRTKGVIFPKDAETPNDARLIGELSKTGLFSGRFIAIPGSSAAAGLRAAYMEPIDSTKYAALKRSLPRPFPGAVTDSVVLFDAHDPKSIPKIEMLVRDGQAAKAAGSLMILTIPDDFQGASALLPIVEELQKGEKRKLPIDTGDLLSETNSISEFVLTLPEGWTAQLPQGFSANSVFGNYRSEYTQVGRELHILHAITWTRGAQAPERLPVLIEWLQKIGGDNAEFIPLTVKN